MSGGDRDGGPREPRIWTAGHSTRGLEELIGMLHEAGVECLADVRRFPTSRRFPHFHRKRLEAGLRAAGLGYEWHEALGGRRPAVVPREASRNAAWKVEGFRHYADYLLTGPGQAAVARLETTARRQRVAVLCAEKLPWRCHRRIIADHLESRGWQVVHLVEAGRVLDHAPGPGARYARGQVTYPRGAGETPGLDFEGRGGTGAEASA